VKKALAATVLVIAAAITGCTTIADSGMGASNAKGQKILSGPDYPTSESGQITVAKISPKSGIAIIPPDMQHVVWRREASVIVAYGEAQKSYDEQPRDQKEPVQRAVRDRWPLLANDMEFDSEIRKLDMCDARNDGCLTNDCFQELEPCEDPQRYLCFMTKVGNYCIEKEREK